MSSLLMTEAQREEQRRRQSKAKRRRVSLSMKVWSTSFQSGELCMGGCPIWLVLVTVTVVRGWRCEKECVVMLETI